MSPQNILFHSTVSVFAKIASALENRMFKLVFSVFFSIFVTYILHKVKLMDYVQINISHDSWNGFYSDVILTVFVMSVIHNLLSLCSTLCVSFYHFRMKTKHRKSAQSFSSQLMSSNNRYLIKSFDFIHQKIFETTYNGSSQGMVLNEPLNVSLKNIDSGAAISTDMYYSMLGVVVIQKPKNVLGIWDLDILPIEKADSPIEGVADDVSFGPSRPVRFNVDEQGIVTHELRHACVFNNYTGMYECVEQNSCDRIFLHSWDCSVLDDELAKLAPFVEYLKKEWKLRDVYFLNKKMMSEPLKLSDGILLDEKYYLSRNGEEKVVFNSDAVDVAKDIRDLLSKRTPNLHGKFIN
ncbi:hypothetical protein [Desulfovibrio sp. JC010]|uniref:hypothetical protein n=1 Tax=Desulfovibrio sp. JC010 TaxID=2593641 RepID=UPI0013D04071|nr:hypothetical protein [Desulfovibrio sp. JC010]NDV26888.1 hypothetical protein [Desulfovibrio sp. JC010]